MTTTGAPVDNGVNVEALIGVQKRSAVYDLLTSPTNVTVNVA